MKHSQQRDLRDQITMGTQAISPDEFRRQARTLHPDVNSAPSAADEFRELIQRRNVNGDLPFAIFPGFRVKADGFWWSVDKATHLGFLCSRRETGHAASVIAERVEKLIPRSAVKAVRCGPQFKYVMLHHSVADKLFNL